MAIKRYESLDGLRGLAALLVLAGHLLDNIFKITAQIPHTIADIAAKSGITLFFLLSGCVMYLGYRERLTLCWRSVLKFFGARFARLYPLYICTLLLYGGVSDLRGHPIMAVFYVTLTQSWVNTELYTYLPAWSISTEWCFYVLFCSGIILLRVCEVKKIITWQTSWIKDHSTYVWLAFVAFCLFIHTCLFTNLNKAAALCSVLQNPNNMDIAGWLRYYSPYVRMLEFCLGIVTGICIVSNNRKSIHLWIIGAGGAVCSGLLLPLQRTPFGQYISCNFLFAPVLSAILIVSIRSQFVKKLFTLPFLVFSGKISYSIYLLQFAIMTVVSALLVGEDLVTRLTRAMSIILFTYCLAHGSYQIIERPAQVAIRGLISRLISARKITRLDVPISGQAEN